MLSVIVAFQDEYCNQILLGIHNPVLWNLRSGVFLWLDLYVATTVRVPFANDLDHQIGTVRLTPVLGALRANVYNVRFAKLARPQADGKRGEEDFTGRLGETC